MKLFFYISLFLILISSCRNNNQTHEDDYEMVWNEEFQYVGLPDSSKWSYDTVGNASGWGNNELQFYTAFNKRNAFVDGEHLVLTALQDTVENKYYTSARLITKNKGDWLYGRFEIKAKLPKGRGLWPAIWMLPTDWEYGNWPSSGEIDIMEHVGYDPDTIVASAHTESYNHVKRTEKNNKIYVPDCEESFHVYALEWEEDEYRAYVDSIHYFTFKNERTSYKEWPFDKRFHIILNLAVGGNWGGLHGVDTTIFPAEMKVDYVRVYKKKDI